MCDSGHHDGDNCADSGIEGEVWDTGADLVQQNVDTKSAFRQVGIAPGGAGGLYVSTGEISFSWTFG